MATIDIKPVIGWAAVDATRPIMKKIVSAMGWGASLISDCVTTTQIAILMFARANPSATTAPLWVMGLGILSGILLFLVLTGGQIYTIGESRWGYRFFLVPDCLITAWQSARLIADFVGLLVPSPSAARNITGIVAAIIGLASAKLPELFMFGPKRRSGGSYDDL